MIEGYSFVSTGFWCKCFFHFFVLVFNYYFYFILNYFLFLIIICFNLIIFFILNYLFLFLIIICFNYFLFLFLVIIILILFFIIFLKLCQDTQLCHCVRIHNCVLVLFLFVQTFFIFSFFKAFSFTFYFPSLKFSRCFPQKITSRYTIVWFVWRVHYCVLLLSWGHDFLIFSIISFTCSFAKVFSF